LDGDEAVGVGEPGEDADVAAVFKLETCDTAKVSVRMRKREM